MWGFLRLEGALRCPGELSGGAAIALCPSLSYLRAYALCSQA